jgi:hypothetical protein
MNEYVVTLTYHTKAESSEAAGAAFSEYLNGIGFVTALVERIDSNGVTQHTTEVEVRR